MLFIFKKKEIVIDTFTCREEVISYAPIVSMVNYFPDWWKDTKPYNKTKMGDSEIQTSTIKKCNGLIELYKTGFVLPLWSDLKIDTRETGDFSYGFSCTWGIIISHNRNEFDQINDRYIHLKIISPWLFKEKSGVNMVATSPKWSHLNNDMNIADVLPGCVKYNTQCTTNINIFLPKQINDILIEHNTPLLHIIPISEKKVVVKNHLISESEFNQKMGADKNAISFNNIYNKKEKLKSKCPFGF